MARVARLAGALLAEIDGRFFLIGNTKEPCDFAAAGFVTPAGIDACRRPYLELATRGPVTLQPPWLVFAGMDGGTGESLAGLIAERFLIQRNGSVSERLWRLVTCGDDAETPEPPGDAIAASWLGEMPAGVWQIVRDAVLRCA